MKTRTEQLKQLIQTARQGHTASWDMTDSELETRPLPHNQHPGVVAVSLVREALSQFDIPSQVGLTYRGMQRLSGHGQHQLRDGIITVNAEFSSLSGHRHYIEVPVVVHGGYAVFPEVFVHEGETQVMAQSAFDDMLRRGDVHTKMQDRLNMYSPPAEPVVLTEIPAVGTGMFGVHATRRQADHVPHGLDPAERDRADRHHPGQTVKLSDTIQVRLRGGSRIIYDAGTPVRIIRDMAGDGYTYYCEFPDRRRAPVHYADLA